MLQLYETVMLPKLIRGNEDYSSVTKLKLKMLNSTLCAGVRYITGTVKSSTVSSLFIDAGEIQQSMYQQFVVKRKQTPSSV